MSCFALKVTLSLSCKRPIVYWHHAGKIDTGFANNSSNPPGRPGVAKDSKGGGGRAGVSPYRKAEWLYGSRLVPLRARAQGYAGCSEGGGAPPLNTENTRGGNNSEIGVNFTCVPTDICCRIVEQ